MNFKGLAITNFTQDVIKDFNIIASDYRLALLGSTTDILVLELRNTHLRFDTFPYRIKRIAIPTERPCSKVIKEIELCPIYENCNVLESQELALDPVYVADCTTEPLKAQMQQIAWAPKYDILLNEDSLVAVVSTYGACHLYVQNKTRRELNTIVCDVNNLYLRVFPLEPMILQNCNDLQAFKNAVDVHWVTAIAWHPQKQILYTANAVGWVVGFELNDGYDLRLSFQYYSDMGRISYMRAFDDFLLIVNVMGVVTLYSIKTVASDGANTSVGDFAMVKVECLWSKADRMSCRKIEVTLCKDSNCYNIVFCKSAHVLAYQLNAYGNILSSCTLYVGGGKITGIETLSDWEFFITTITGTVKHIRLDSNDSNDLQISEQIIKTEFDANNYQLLGVTATPHKQIWTFMLYRSKDYTHHSKYISTSALVSVCKLSTMVSLRELINFNIKTLDPLLDYVVAVRLEIFNNLRQEEFKNYFNLEKARFPTELNDAFIQKLQLKLMLTKFKAAFETEIFKNIKVVTQNELDFLSCSVQTTHIICSLQKLNAKIGGKAPTRFQLLVGTCLKRKFQTLLRDLQTQINEQNIIKDTIERYLKIVMESFKKIPNNYEYEEQCLLCQRLVDETTMLCPEAHKVRRCCITFVQLPFFNNRYCAQCNEVALDDDNQLSEVVEPNEVFHCTFCRFALVNHSM